MTIQVNDVLEEAAKDHIKKLFGVFVLNRKDKDKSAKGKFDIELKFVIDALEELNGPSTA